MKLLSIDCETTGNNAANTDLIELACAVWEDGKVIDKDHWYVDTNPMPFDRQGLKNERFLNNVINHQGFNFSKEEMILQFRGFMFKHFGKTKAMTLWYNATFDVPFIQKFLGYEVYNAEFITPSIDTVGVILYLQQTGKLPKDLYVNDIFNHFGIDVSKNKNALDDCVATAELYTKLLEVLK